MSIRYLARCPKFPILIETDHKVVGAPNSEEIERLAYENAFKSKDQYKVVDSAGEGWTFVSKLNALSPLTLNKTWTKQRIIDFFNSSVSKAGVSQRYAAGNLSNKRVDHIIGEIIQFEKTL